MLDIHYLKSKRFLIPISLFLIFIVLSTAVLVKLADNTVDNGWLDWLTEVEKVNDEAYIVSHVTDGDTIEVEKKGVKLKVRYIGVDTPETVQPNTPVQCFGKKASDYNKSLVLGKKVRLESDAGDTDRYGRKLRYVYLIGGDFKGQMVNELLLKNGYARIETVQPNVKYVETFRKLEQEARQKDIGLWKECTD